ncbi:MAG TPA: DUF4340 domain-containing protein [Thioalkalivibrio sp.]|nr:DUF4340 domain-containing protein [Thioalkalivibrio sp.]
MASQRTRLLINLGLLLAVAVLAAIALLGRGTDAPGERLTALDPERVARITVHGEDQPPVRLERRGAHWWLTSPWELEASPRRIADLAALANAPSRAAYAAATLDLARYGLAPPRMRLELDDTVIEFGATNPVTRQRYARVGDTVHLIDDTHTYLLNATTESYLGPRLLPREAQIVTLALPDRRIERDATGGWRTDGAETTPDDAQALIDAWRRAEALWARPFIPQDDLPEVRITLADGQVLRFAVAGTAPDLLLARPDLGFVYTLPAEAAAGLLDTPGAAEERD